MNQQIQQIYEKLKKRRMQPLSPKQIWDQALESEIESLQISKMLSDRKAIALMAALYLLNDSLDKSHSYAQQIEDDPTGAYWHGLMHRMEGDYSNSKYWFSRSGHHPVTETARQSISEQLKSVNWERLPIDSIREKLQQFRDESSWNPAGFTDLIQLQKHEPASAETRDLLGRLQHIEISALYNYTYNAYMNH